MVKTNIAVLGAQWGDEGKGKIVDMLTPHFSTVARYQGGHNAGPHGVRGRPEVRAPPHPVGHPARRRDVHDRQRRGDRSRRAVQGSGRAGTRRRVGGRTPARQREGAHHPAVSPRARRAVGGAPRRAQDRHDVARHRSRLRGQDRTPRHPRVRRAGRSRGARDRGARERQRAQPRDQGFDARLAAGVRPAGGPGRADEAVGGRRVAGPAPDDRGGEVGALRRRPGHAAGHRPRHLSVRDLVKRLDWRRLHGVRGGAQGDRRRAGRGQGLHHPGGGGAAADRAQRAIWPIACARRARSTAPPPDARAAAAGTTPWWSATPRA